MCEPPRAHRVAACCALGARSACLLGHPAHLPAALCRLCGLWGRRRGAPRTPARRSTAPACGAFRGRSRGTSPRVRLALLLARHMTAYAPACGAVCACWYNSTTNAAQRARGASSARRHKSQPPVKRVVCTRAKSPLIPASVSRRWLSLCSSLLPLSLLPPFKGRSYYLPLPLKGSSYSRTLSLSSAISRCSCSSIYFLIVASFSPTVDT